MLLVEEKLKNNQRLKEVSCAIAKEWLDCYDDLSNNEMYDKWTDCIDALSEAPWVGGQHYGDCTKEPNTCMRCFVEEMVKNAEKIMR